MKIKPRAAKRPGVTVLVEKYVNNELVERCIIPVILTPSLRYGKTYWISIAMSGTLTKQHVSWIYRISRELIEKYNLLQPVIYEPIRRTRKTVIVDVDSSYKNRSYVSSIAVKLLEKNKGIKHVIVASSTWRDVKINNQTLGKYLEKMGYSLGKVHSLSELLTEMIAEGKIRSWKELRELYTTGAYSIVKKMGGILLTEDYVLMLSPLSGVSRGINIISPASETELNVLVLSENVRLLNEDVVARQAYLETKYPLSRGYAIAVTSLLQGICSVIQSVGRVQRSERHRVNVWMFGKYFKRYLIQYEIIPYRDLYGCTVVITDKELLENLEEG